MKQVLVIRLSALGDVAMAIPVVYSLAESYPDVQFTFVTQPAAAGLFINRPDNLSVFPADVKGRYCGPGGMFRLFRELRKKYRFDVMADLHDVLRTRILRYLFGISGIRAVCINKERDAKKRLTRRRNKEKKPLKTSFERYADVFGRLGFAFRPEFVSMYGKGRGDRNIFSDICAVKEGVCRIGIAPFAKHRGKIYPPESMEKVVRYFACGGNQVFLFGGGKEESRILADWAARYPNTVCMAGKYGFEKELALISWLDVMVSMDSANMHLASLVGVPVVSVWGATHPYAGFMGWRQDMRNSIGAHLCCRPCSVFGNKPCFRGDYACLKNICPEMIIGRVESILNGKKDCSE